MEISLPHPVALCLLENSMTPHGNFHVPPGGQVMEISMHHPLHCIALASSYSGPSKAKNQQFLSNKIESTNCTETLSHFSLFCNCLSICVFLLFKTLKVRRLCSSSKGFLKLAAIPGVSPVCVFVGLTTVWRCSYIFHI